MSLKKTLAGAMPFAHLLSKGSRAARAEDQQDDERKQRDGESDDDYAKRMEELDEEDARKAEEERKKEEEAQRRADNGGNDVDGDDADAEDQEDDEDAKAARARERTRCARIVAHGIKIGAVRQAGVFAFDTKMSSAAAIAALNAGRLDSPARAAQKPGLRERMSTVSAPIPGGTGGAAAPSLAEQIVMAGKKRRGEI
jgi:hypothetical protein